MSFHALDVVVLNTDLPAQGLKRGDLGAVVDVYSPDAIEVEFVTASGRTQAVITLRTSDIREVGDGDLVAVRHVETSPGRGEAPDSFAPERKKRHPSITAARTASRCQVS